MCAGAHTFGQDCESDGKAELRIILVLWSEEKFASGFLHYVSNLVNFFNLLIFRDTSFFGLRNVTPQAVG